MSDGALITMILILGIVWGGFVLLLIYALRREARKSRRDGTQGDGDTQGDNDTRGDGGAGGQDKTHS